MKTGIQIAVLIGLTLLLSLTSCTKKCQVNGCRVRMEHRHSGDKFKSKIRRWYTFQNPRVGRDYKRDISPDKIPWDGPDLDRSAEADMLVSNDTSAFGEEDFMGDSFYEGDSLSGEDEIVTPAEETGKKKKRKRRGEEEEEIKEEPAGDPWDIEHIKEEDPVVRKPIEDDKGENLENKELSPEENKEDKKEEDKEKSKEEKKEEKKEKKKSKKEIAKEREEQLKEELLEEEEEDDDWGF